MSMSEIKNKENIWNKWGNLSSRRLRLNDVHTATNGVQRSVLKEDDLESKHRCFENWLNANAGEAKGSYKFCSRDLKIALTFTKCYFFQMADRGRLNNSDDDVIINV